MTDIKAKKRKQATTTLSVPKEIIVKTYTDGFVDIGVASLERNVKKLEKKLKMAKKMLAQGKLVQDELRKKDQ